MSEDFLLGQRVRVAAAHHWARGATGCIGSPPTDSVDFTSQPRVVAREVDSPDGKRVFLWVEFDRPQYSASGEGPYLAGEIEMKYLEKLPGPAEPLATP